MWYADSIVFISQFHPGEYPIKRYTPKFLILLLLAGALSMFTPQAVEQALAQSQNLFKSKQLEQQSRQFLHLIRKSVNLSTDIQIDTYVSNLAKKMARNANMDSDPLSYYVAIDPAINAFAGPGATFFINTGIIQTAESEGQLASVIAHELAHHKQDHLSRLMENYKSSVLPTVLLVLAGIAVGGEEGIAAAAGAQAAQVEAMIDHTLVYEREADAVGLQILTASDYSPIEARDFMITLERKIREQGLFQSNIHNTHPITPERIASFEARVKQYEKGGYKKVAESPDTGEFHFIRARTRVLYDWDPQKTFRYFEEQLSDDSDDEQLAIHYGHALSLAKDGNTDLARKKLDVLRSLYPDNTWFLKAAAEVELAANEFIAAKQLLEEVALAPEPEAAVVALYTRALIRTGDLQSANRYIRKHIPRFPNSLQLYKLQAEAALKVDDILTGYLAEVEYLYRLGDLEPALGALRVAENQLNDFYSNEVIKEKKRVIVKEINWRQQ